MVLHDVHVVTALTPQLSIEQLPQLVQLGDLRLSVWGEGAALPARSAISGLMYVVMSFKHGSVGLNSRDKIAVYTQLYCLVWVGFNSNRICGCAICCNTDRAKLGFSGGVEPIA